ncbi:MAG: molecular chaperone DnaJ [Planctomycetota bacterium]|nr:molecular chaperone DnaJ [Planctomycetota bacterium]
MPEKRDYYEVLGVERNATDEDIKRAYRKGALKHHPDNAQGDKAQAETKFKELAEAYEVLHDPDKRQRYDRYGHAGLRGAGVHDFSSMGFGDIFSMFNDIFSGMGFSGRGESAGQRGYDLETEVELTLEEVAAGVERTLEFERMDLCETCSGSGAKPGGYGQVQQQVAGFFGVSVRITACPACKGRGSTVKDPCPHCRGVGRARKHRVVKVRIPAGVQEGQVVRVSGEGEPGPNNDTRGDLHCYVRVAAHPLLARRGDDLICQAPVPFSLAALGGKLEVPTLAGPEEIEVPAGIQNGEVVALRGRGLPNLRSARKGDQLVQVFIEVPRKITKKQREILSALAETDNVEISPQRKTFMDKLKDTFKRASS